MPMLISRPPLIVFPTAEPEVEVGASPEVLLTPITIARNENERVLIEVNLSST